MSDVIRDVHTEHCCAQHGCKYSDSDCPVASGNKPQSYPCESCEWGEDEWRMRAYDLEANWSRCSRACAGEQTKREQAEARAGRLAEALRVLADAFESRMADEENPDWNECWNNAHALLRELEQGK